MNELTGDQRKKVQNWFDEKAPLVGKCPMCGHREWSLGSHLVVPPVFSDGDLFIGGTAYPFIMLTCGHCGNTQFHSAVMIGLLPSSSTPQSEEPK